MGLWSTIKSAVSSLFNKEDDNKKSSSSSTSKISVAGSMYNTKPATKASKKPTSSKITTSSSKTTTNTKTSTASTPKITTTGSKGFREIEAASNKSTS